MSADWGRLQENRPAYHPHAAHPAPSEETFEKEDKYDRCNACAGTADGDTDSFQDQDDAHANGARNEERATTNTIDRVPRHEAGQDVPDLQETAHEDGHLRRKA